MIRFNQISSIPLGFKLIAVIALNILAILPAYAAEVKNAVVRQEGNRVVFVYDLDGNEQEADVSLTVTIKDKKYEAKDLHFEGDIGKVKTGRSNKIYWNVLQDFPKGLSDSFTWELTAGQWQVGELTMLDTKTKLMWTRNGNLAGKPMNWDNAHAYIQKLNNERYAGYSNWRLPDKEELETLTQRGKDAGYGSFEKKISDFLNGLGFINVETTYYWSSTTYASYSGDAWGVGMFFGRVDHLYKGNSFFVMPIRDGE